MPVSPEFGRREWDAEQGIRQFAGLRTSEKLNGTRF